MSLVERIIGQGLQKPFAPALSVSTRIPDIVTYGALNHGIANLCKRLTALGVAPGRLYGLHITEELLHIAMTLALEYLGAATVIVPDPDRVDGWPIDAIFVWGRKEGWVFPVERVDVDWLEGDGDYRLKTDRHYPPDDLCSVVWTSGSTGTPKGIPLTHRVAELRVEQYDYRVGPEFNAYTRVFCPIGFSSGWGYNIVTHTLSRGRLLCLPAASFDQTMRKFAAYGLQAMIASPLYLAEFGQLSRKERKDVQSLRVIVSGGGVLQKSLVENIRSGVCNRVVNSYSSAESGWVAGAPVELLDLDQGETGFVAPGVTVEIVDPVTRQPVSEGVGCVRVRSDCVVRGYFGPRTDEENRFEDHAFCSRDLATLSPDGLLSVLGRDSNVVNLGGPKATLELIETHYAAAPGVSEAASVVATDSLGINRIVAVIVPSDQWSEGEFWRHCHANVAPAFWPKRLVVVPRLPRVATGKVDRQKLPTLL